MHSPSPSPPEAGPSQYTPPQVPIVIPQKQGSDPQPGENVSPLRYGLRRSTHEIRVPHREGNIYGEDHYLIDVLKYPKWQQHPGETDPDMACRILENAHRYIQAQPNTIPIGEVYYLYSQWDITIEINRICYKVDWIEQRPIIINIEGNRMNAPPSAGKSATIAITNHMVCLVREGGAEHICFLLALRATETYFLSKTLSWLSKMAKSLFIFLFLFFFFYLGLTIQKRVQKSITSHSHSYMKKNKKSQCHIIWCHMIGHIIGMGK